MTPAIYALPSCLMLLLAGPSPVFGAAEERPDARALLEEAVHQTRLARQTGDSAHYERALAAIERAREADPGLAELQKVEAWVRLGRHEFARAEDLAAAWTASHPDDPEGWGLLGDARMERGRTSEAREAYERMLALRPGPSAYVRASYWLERRGRPEAALALMERAWRATSPREPDQQAWVLVQRASLERELGRAEAAEASLALALDVLPAYHHALAELASLRLAQERHAEALALADRLLAAVPHPEHRLLRADALRGLGREAEARAAEDAFEREALANVDAADNENAFLVDFYLDRRPDPERALALARREAARRRDAPTLERLARALARNDLGTESIRGASAH